jgi:hypothetical protein
MGTEGEEETMTVLTEAEARTARRPSPGMP